MPENYIPIETRQYVRQRAMYCCEYCYAISHFAFHPFPIDHIIPTSKGGDSSPDNLALSCQHCNNAKYNKTKGIDPLTNATASLFHPRLNDWSDHFIWDEEEIRILGITPIGRTTVYTLKLNREAAVNIRRALKLFGSHPPRFD